MPTVNVSGMTCEHCKKSVTEAISKLPGIVQVTVDLQKGEASWQDADPAVPASVAAVKAAVKSIGFDAQ